jgi:hypothetical protein
VGLVASGGGAVGFVAQGGGAYGYYARGGGAGGAHVISMQPPVTSPAAVEFFERFCWLVGSFQPNSLSMLSQAAVPLVATVAVAAGVALVALFALRREPNEH